jgi:hypothetical protein
MLTKILTTSAKLRIISTNFEGEARKKILSETGFQRPSENHSDFSKKVKMSKKFSGLAKIE